MSHEVETMAYNMVEKPWHGLGVPVVGDLTPAQMQEKAGLNWTVRLVPAFIEINGEKRSISHSALVRDSDDKMLDVVTDDWKPVQNTEAFEFFNEFVAAGDMSMETAGSLKGGQLVWALAKIKDSFELLGGRDKIDSYMLFTNPFQYGWSTSVSWTAIRVVCWNTFTAAMTDTTKEKIVKVTHRREFVAEQVKEALGISKQKLAKYKEVAQFLTTKKAKDEDIVEYFKRLYPILSKKEESKEKVSSSAKKLMECLTTQPGSDLGAGTWWQPYNAVTYFTDHVASKTVDTRLASAWYGDNRKRKIKALELAAEMADAS